ncbi:MAG: nitrogenase component 1 [Lachnospiraceae bacterium]
MAKLSIWIPPFSPDYSGAAAVLFDLKTVTAMHDASGCTGNYTGYDEPRWYGSRSGIFCSGLREIDAVLGNDDKLLNKMEAAARDIKPDIMALIGSPVPMVIGTDMNGLAYELEERTAIPCFGFDTTGTKYYDQGAFMAARALLDRFARPMPQVPGRVNLIGANPMDFGNGEELNDLKELLAGRGYSIGLSMAMDYTLEDIRCAAQAEVNLAISRFGYLTARYLEKQFGIPFLCGYPAGINGAQYWLDSLEEVRRTGVSQVLTGDLSVGGTKVLIVGEQVMANALRLALQLDMQEYDITVGCIFGKEAALAAAADVDLPDEKRIRQEINKPEYQCIIADPFMKMLLRDEQKEKLIPFAQYAVSSKLGIRERVMVTQDKFNSWYEKEKRQ